MSLQKDHSNLNNIRNALKFPLLKLTYTFNDFPLNEMLLMARLYKVRKRHM